MGDRAINEHDVEKIDIRLSSLKTWQSVLPFVKPYRGRIALLCLFMFFAAGVDTVMPLLSGYAVAQFIIPMTTDGIWLFVAFCVVLIIFQVTTTILMAKNAIRVEMNISRDLKSAMYRHLQTLGFDYFNTTPVGTTLARVMSDTMRIGTIFAWSLVDIVWSVACIVGYVVMMFNINVTLALIVVSVVPFITVLTYIFQHKILLANRQVRFVNSELTRAYNEGISGAKTSKTLVIEHKNLLGFKSITTDMKHSSVHASMLSAVYIPIVAALTSVAVAMVITFGGDMVIAETLGVDGLAVFINYALVIAAPVSQLARSLSTFVAAQVNVERCEQLLGVEPMITDTPEVEEKYGTTFEPKEENWEPIKGHITYENLTFMYHDGNENVLENFNLDVPAGTTVAIVGETGAGKSTLVNLTCRFFEPTGGRILIDGVDYKERSVLWLHSSIGYVLQSPHLFSGSVMENIRYGRLDATDEDVIAAAKLVNVHDTVMAMKEGYDSEVGEGGTHLSTGEKQLISFARAIIANPAIFVLDEATASIDTKTEELIQEAIAKLIGSRTSFLIAHRLSTIRKADVILVVKDGKIIEKGTNSELLKKGGYYADLYEKQFAEEATEHILNED